MPPARTASRRWRSHAALACTTERVRCGSLVYCAGYRHPAVLANALATIDHLSGGRADLGLGAGWAVNEYQAYGIPFPSAGERLDLLEESVQCVRSLLRNETTSFEGRYFTLTDARCEPRPVQAELPIWIGGGGEKRTLRIAARWADGWNVPFVSPEEFARKREVLAGHCADVGRDPAEIRCTVNVGLALDDDALRRQFGAIAEFVRPGVLIGSGQAAGRRRRPLRRRRRRPGQHRPPGAVGARRPRSARRRARPVLTVSPAHPFFVPAFADRPHAVLRPDDRPPTPRAKADRPTILPARENRGGGTPAGRLPSRR